MNIKLYFSRYTFFYEFYKDENLILEKGLDVYYKPVVLVLPILLTVIILTLNYFLQTDLNTYMKNLISILPSLIGFLIASATILITVESKEIDKVHTDKYTFREIGGAIFFYATKIAIFLLIVAFISTDNLISILHQYLYCFILIGVIYYFSKMVIAIFYGLMFLSDIIQSIKKS